MITLTRTEVRNACVTLRETTDVLLGMLSKGTPQKDLVLTLATELAHIEETLSHLLETTDERLDEDSEELTS